MNKSIQRISVIALALGVFASCSKDEAAPNSFRTTKINYTTLAANASYKTTFVDEQGASTVDLTAGNERIDMFRALDAYGKLPNPVGSTSVLDAAVLSNMFTNSNAPFSGTYANLNSSVEKLSSKTALSQANSAAIVALIQSQFVKLATTSQSVGEVAEQGKAGKLKTYLLDANGIEWIQVISKSLMGAYQLDYIGNTLLSDASINAANNTKLVSGKNYSELEHVWDEAYATLTPNAVYLDSATDVKRGTEYFIGTYIWEYNQAGYPKIHPAFVKGRAAIINGDLAEVKNQALIIRTEMEKALAGSAIRYLQKTKDLATDAGARAHAYGEGLGFIYSLRFCKIKQADASFSDNLLNNIGFNGTGIWTLTNAQADEAMNTIRAKFDL